MGHEVWVSMNSAPICSDVAIPIPSQGSSLSRWTNDDTVLSSTADLVGVHSFTYILDQEFYSRATVGVQQVKLLPVFLASHMGTSFSPSNSASHLVPCECAWEHRKGWPKSLGPCTHMGDPDGVAASVFCLAQTWPLWLFGEVNQ